MAIDWTKPAYAAYTVRQGTTSYVLSRIRCDLCDRKIGIGEKWARGPRGAKGVHAECRDKLIAGRAGE